MTIYLGQRREWWEQAKLHHAEVIFDLREKWHDAISRRDTCRAQLKIAQFPREIIPLEKELEFLVEEVKKLKMDLNRANLQKERDLHEIKKLAMEDRKGEEELKRKIEEITKKMHDGEIE